jgi:hypothetical protein
LSLEDSSTLLVDHVSTSAEQIALMLTAGNDPMH